ncbi:hypothetical protein Ndes2526B_g05231 [Nannochloris sp. 'desiccata']|nr:hypothetical protein NADE_008260 [Chlorella desiccata (nom. nud.)]
MHHAIPATLLLCLLVMSTASAQDAADGEMVLETGVDALAPKNEVSASLVACAPGAPCGWYQTNQRLTFTRDARDRSVSVLCPGVVWATSCSCRNVANDGCLELVNSYPSGDVAPGGDRFAPTCICDYRYTCSIRRGANREVDVSAFAFCQ